MAIRVKRITTWKKQDVKYHFTDGTRLIHDSKKYNINFKSPENEVDIDYTNFKTNNTIGYKFKDRGSEPPTTYDDDEYYTHPYGGRTEIPRTGVPRLGWSISDGRTTTYGAGSSSDYTAATRGLSRCEVISRSASTTKITHTNPNWTEWNAKGTTGTAHTKEPERTEEMIIKERETGRIK